MKKAMVALLLVAASAYAVNQVGKLFVHMPPGFEVIVDGTSYGPTTAAEGGRILQLPPGAHRVVVRSAEGREGSFNVTLAAGEARDVTMSPLGLRKKLAPSQGDETTGALRVSCIPDDCTVTFKPPVDAVPAGRYPLAVNRGTAVLRTDVDVPATMIVTVEANFNTGTIRTVDARKRPQKLAVVEANDALTRLAVPPHWKTAIRGALPSGIGIEGATAYTNGVRVTLRIPSADVARSMFISILNSHQFADVQAPSEPRQDKSGVLWDLVFLFAD